MFFASRILRVIVVACNLYLEARINPNGSKKLYIPDAPAILKERNESILADFEHVSEP